MIVVYDLATSPPQYDFCSFLVAAEIERCRRNEDHIDLLFAPGPNNGFRKRSLWPATTEEHIRLMENLAIPLAWMLPSVRKVEWLRNRHGVEEHFGAGQKLYGFMQELENLSSPFGRPLNVPRVARQPSLLTITLREADHLPVRNSNFDEWLKAADMLQRKGWGVVFVRDTAKAGQEIPNFKCAHDASVNVRFRAWLYRAATMNLFVNSGPMAFAIYMNAPVMNFRPVCDEHGASNSGYLEKCGFPIGSQLPLSPPWQRYVWEDDDARCIVNSVSDMADSGICW